MWSKIAHYYSNEKNKFGELKKPDFLLCYSNQNRIFCVMKNIFVNEKNKWPTYICTIDFQPNWQERSIFFNNRVWIITYTQKLILEPLSNTIYKTQVEIDHISRGKL